MLEYQDMHCLLILICIMKYPVALARAIFVPRAWLLDLIYIMIKLFIVMLLLSASLFVTKLSTVNIFWKGHVYIKIIESGLYSGPTLKCCHRVHRYCCHYLLYYKGTLKTILGTLKKLSPVETSQSLYTKKIVLGFQHY
jgi:hypothetical protein